MIISPMYFPFYHPAKRKLTKLYAENSFFNNSLRNFLKKQLFREGRCSSGNESYNLTSRLLRTFQIDLQRKILSIGIYGSTECFRNTWIYRTRKNYTLASPHDQNFFQTIRPINLNRNRFTSCPPGMQ